MKILVEDNAENLVAAAKDFQADFRDKLGAGLDSRGGSRIIRERIETHRYAKTLVLPVVPVLGNKNDNPDMLSW